MNVINLLTLTSTCIGFGKTDNIPSFGRLYYREDEIESLINHNSVKPLLILF